MFRCNAGVDFYMDVNDLFFLNMVVRILLDVNFDGAKSIPYALNVRWRPFAPLLGVAAAKVCFVLCCAYRLSPSSHMRTRVGSAPAALSTGRRFQGGRQYRQHWRSARVRLRATRLGAAGLRATRLGAASFTELLFVILGLVMSIFVPHSWSGHAVVTWITVTRVIMGFGVGGNYPLSAAVIADRAHVARRGTLLAALFSRAGAASLARSPR